MVCIGIEYGDTQLISQAHDVLKTAGGLSNGELSKVEKSCLQMELKNLLVEIGCIVLTVKDEGTEAYVLVRIDQPGSKGTENGCAAGCRFVHRRLQKSRLGSDVAA